MNIAFIIPYQLLIKLYPNNNLKIIDFSLNEINGGSIEVICAKKILPTNQITIKLIII